MSDIAQAESHHDAWLRVCKLYVKFAAWLINKHICHYNIKQSLMNTSIFKILISSIIFLSSGAASIYAQEQPDSPDMNEIAEKEADRLQHLLNLEDWQVFYVDSTLKHDFPAMQEEMIKLQSAKVSNSSMYVAVQDKWMERIDNSYRKFFSATQWEAYMKSGAAKLQKAREKRKQKALEDEAKLKEKLGK